jgi:hypothetical protein
MEKKVAIVQALFVDGFQVIRDGKKIYQDTSFFCTYSQ